MSGRRLAPSHNSLTALLASDASGFRNSLRLMLRLARGQSRQMLPAMAAAAVLSLLALLPAALLARLIDHAFASRSHAAVIGIAGAIGAIALADALLGFGRRLF